MNPKKLGSVDNHRQEPWKMPLPQFIEVLYEQRFARARPKIVVSIEERAKTWARKKAVKRAAKKKRRAAAVVLTTGGRETTGE